MKAVASRVTDETYTPSWLQTPRLKRLAEIVSAQAVLQQQIDAKGAGAGQLDGHEEDGDLGGGTRNGYGRHSGGYSGNGEILSEEEEGDGDMAMQR
jgi:myosin-5